MAQGLPRTHFNSSRLVRVLAELTATDVAESKQSLGERLGQWLDFKDALALFSALNADTAGAPEPGAAAPGVESAAVRKAFAAVRGALAASMTVDEVREAGAGMDAAADFAPYHRYYLARQRDMSVKIGPLRATVRAALSRHSPALRRIALLDAVLDQAWAARERDLLATVPVFLARRFEQLRDAHRATPEAAQQPDRRMQAGWLAEFCDELRSVLAAELDLRLQPVSGLIAALDHEVTGKQ